MPTYEPIEAVKDARTHRNLRRDGKQGELIQSNRLVDVDGTTEDSVYVGDVSFFAHFAIL